MTASQAQAAANPAAADQQDSGSEDVVDAESDDFTGSGAAPQQLAMQISNVQEQLNAVLLQHAPDGISRVERAADVAGGCHRRDNEHDSLADAEMLIIEDAAELTCDRAAVILRQLSCKCQAAESVAHKPEATCNTSAADEQLQRTSQNQVEPDCKPAACRTDAKVSAMALLLPETVAEGPEEKVTELQQGHANVSDSAIHAAGVQRDAGRLLPSPGGHASTSRDIPSASSIAATYQANSGRDVSHDAACPSMQQGFDDPPSSAARAPSQQGVSNSSFLQRLQMSKDAAASGLNATHLQAEDSRQGEQRTYAVHLAF